MIGREFCIPCRVSSVRRFVRAGYQILLDLYLLRLTLQPISALECDL